MLVRQKMLTTCTIAGDTAPRCWADGLTKAYKLSYKLSSLLFMIYWWYWYQILIVSGIFTALSEDVTYSVSEVITMLQWGAPLLKASDWFSDNGDSVSSVQFKDSLLKIHSYMYWTPLYTTRWTVNDQDHGNNNNNELTVPSDNAFVKYSVLKLQQNCNCKSTPYCLDTFILVVTLVWFCLRTSLFCISRFEVSCPQQEETSQHHTGRWEPAWVGITAQIIQ